MIDDLCELSHVIFFQCLLLVHSFQGDTRYGEPRLTECKLTLFSCWQHAYSAGNVKHRESYSERAVCWSRLQRRNVVSSAEGVRRALALWAPFKTRNGALFWPLFFSVAMGPLGGLGALFRNVDSQEWALFLVLGSLWGQKMKVGKYENHMKHPTDLPKIPVA